MSATAPSIASGFVANNPPNTDTDDLVAATIAANAAQQDFDATHPVPPGIESATGRVAKARAKKSPGSGAKRSEASKRKFICSFSHYGCDVALSSKNEWKRHVSIQHLQLGFYRCDVGSCNPDNNPNTPPSKKVYNDFNRKDLFTQHHRRMHKPESGPGSGSSDQNSSDWRSFEDSLEEVRQRCWQEKRRPPQRSTCGFCARVFEGEGSWNERMEHVGGHYARDLPEACREEREDEDLTNWAIQEGVVKEAPNGRHVLIDQPVSAIDRPFGRRSLDATMSDAPPISPTNGQLDGQFIGMDDTRLHSLQSSYPPLNGTGRPGSSSGQHYAPYPLRNVSLTSGYSTWQDPVSISSVTEHVPNPKNDSDRLEDLINTLINPKKPRMSKRLQWRCDCGLDCAVDFAEDNPHDQRAFENLGRISIICKNSQSPYLKTSKGEQYEIIPCDHLSGYITREGKMTTGQSMLPKVEEMTEEHQGEDGVATVDALETAV